MKKTVYSLVLSEDVVLAIDRLAYASGTNRSNMVNQILAQYVSYETPEMRMKNVFGRISELLGENESFRLMSGTSDSIISLRSSLVYKYNPSIRYSIELYKTAGGRSAFAKGAGEIKVSLRSQNEMLINYFTSFCHVWQDIEAAYGIGIPYGISLGRYSRLIVPRKNEHYCIKDVKQKSLGDKIADYISVYDKALKLFFTDPNLPERYMNELAQLYGEYLESESEII